MKLENIFKNLKKGIIAFGLPLLMNSSVQGNLIAHYSFEDADWVYVYDSSGNGNCAVWNADSYLASEGRLSNHSGGFPGNWGSYLHLQLSIPSEEGWKQIPLEDTFQTMWVKPFGRKNWRFLNSRYHEVPVGNLLYQGRNFGPQIGSNFHGLIDEIKIHYPIPERKKEKKIKEKKNE